MKRTFILLALSLTSTLSFAQRCFDTPEYKASSDALATHLSQNSEQIKLATGFLVLQKKISVNAAIKEVVGFSSPETIAYDKKLEEVALKIKNIQPDQSPQACLNLIETQKEYRKIGDEKVTFIVNKIFEQAGAAEFKTKNKSQCHKQTTQGVDMEICLVKGDAFQHDIYTLKSNDTLIFALIDDYVEQVKLEHIIPEGVAIELPLSRQGTKSTQIIGGCVPESKNNTEVARVCNFSWGKLPIINNVRFDFK